ncbi:MAG: NAD(P)-binding protein [Paracoccaceae bacterium]|nr:MAG: NAD(P)-binding protein [Paracoccaceae bacterium]
MSERSVVVVGAGMAGLACAQGLAAAGWRVRVLDKGRGLGGRLATRRTAEGAYDHGGVVLRPEGDALAGWLRQAAAAGAAAEWQGGFTGLPGMSGIVAPLAAGLEVSVQAEATGLMRDGGGWIVAGQGFAHRAGAVVLAIPQPQALRLCGGLAVAGAIGAASMRGCWAAMAAFGTPLPLAADLVEWPDSAVARIVHENAKPGRSGGPARYVVQAGAAWSAAHLERERDEAARMLLAEALAQAGLRPVAPLALHGHRWRFGFTDVALGQSHVWDGGAGIGLCGDWCLGTGAGAALDSGRALAAAMVAARPAGPPGGQ